MDWIRFAQQPDLDKTGFVTVRINRSAPVRITQAGDFTGGAAGCSANDLDDTTLPFPGDPTVNQGIWLLVRDVHCGGNGTYDSGGPGQVEPRDAEIEASFASCP